MLDGGMPIAGPRVFVSSTYKDLVEHRRAVIEQIVRRDMRFRGMEHFGADPDGRAPEGADCRRRSSIRRVYRHFRYAIR